MLGLSFNITIIFFKKIIVPDIYRTPPKDISKVASSPACLYHVGCFGRVVRLWNHTLHLHHHLLLDLLRPDLLLELLPLEHPPSS